MPLELPTVRRVEVIDHTSTGTGRVLVRTGVSVSLSVQDDGATLKVFVDDAPSRRPR